MRSETKCALGGKNTRLIGLMFGLLIPILLVAFAFSGCEKVQDVYILSSGYETVAGIYDVHVLETEDSCDPETEFFDIWDWLIVRTQEKFDDGGYVIDLSLNDLQWYDVVVEPDGTFYAERDDWGIYIKRAMGVITPDEVEFSIELEVFDFYGEFDCAVYYEVEGRSLFLNARPPDK